MMLLSGCIHTYPEGERGQEPGQTSVEVILQLSMPGDWQKSETRIHSVRSQGKYPKRVILEILRDGLPEIRKETTINAEDIDGSSFNATFTLKLERKKYRMLVWCDNMSPPSGEPTTYDATDFGDIHSIGPEPDATSAFDCQCYSGNLDLTDKDMNEQRLIIPVDMSRPDGRFRIVADDYDLFLKTFEDAISRGETFFFEMKYECSIPGAFNLYNDTPSQPLDNAITSSDLDIITIPGIEMEIASGRMFLPPDGMDITLSITLYNSAKAIISRTTGITFPMHRATVTTVRGNFLTDFISGGISIDTAWDGEIIIDFDNN